MISPALITTSSPKSGTLKLLYLCIFASTPASMVNHLPPKATCRLVSAPLDTGADTGSYALGRHMTCALLVERGRVGFLGI